MEFFTGNCSRCSTKGVSFKVLREVQWEKKVGIKAHSFRDIFAICGICGRGVVTTFSGGRLLAMAPSPPDPPKHLPGNVESFFNQAMNNLPKHFDAAGAMFRKALDVGLKVKFPDLQGRLIDRIKRAAEAHDLTPELAEWADRIRLDGNEASHGQEPLSEQDAQRLYEFTHLVLLYLFTLPNMLARAKGTDPEAT